jgi:hypothetical protein
LDREEYSQVITRIEKVLFGIRSSVLPPNPEGHICRERPLTVRREFQYLQRRSHFGRYKGMESTEIDWLISRFENKREITEFGKII